MCFALCFKWGKVKILPLGPRLPSRVSLHLHPRLARLAAPLSLSVERPCAPCAPCLHTARRARRGGAPLRRHPARPNPPRPEPSAGAAGPAVARGCGGPAISGIRPKKGMKGGKSRRASPHLESGGPGGKGNGCRGVPAWLRGY